MNKLGLAAELKTKFSITRSESEQVVQIFIDTMENSLANGDHVEIRTFCSFRVKKYKSYIGRNPKTGEKDKVKSKKLPSFKCGNELRKRVDY